METEPGNSLNAPTWSSALSSLAILVSLLCIVVACSTSGSPSNRALERLLDATTTEDSNNAFRNHGPIREEELPVIFEATRSNIDYRRRNAAQLLRTTAKGNVVELKKRVVLETKYVEVWAIVLDSLLEKDPDMAGKRPDMIKAALEDSNADTLAVGLRAAILSNYPGAHELVRKYFDHKNAKVRAAAVSGLTAEDVRELLPRLVDMVSKEEDEDTFIILAKSLIRTNDDGAANVVTKSIEDRKVKRDGLYLHFFNDVALFTLPDPMITKFLFRLARGKTTLRDDAFSVFSRWVWSINREPIREFVQICVAEIKTGNLSIDPRRRPEASSEQDECEIMFSFMNNGKNPIDDFAGRVRGKDAVAFGEKWLKEHGS